MDFSGQIYNQEGTMLKHIIHRYHDICIFSVFLTPFNCSQLPPNPPDSHMTYESGGLNRKQVKNKNNISFVSFHI